MHQPIGRSAAPPERPRGVLHLLLPALLLTAVMVTALAPPLHLPAPATVARALRTALRPWLPGTYRPAGPVAPPPDVVQRFDTRLHRDFLRLGRVLGAGPAQVDQALAPTDRLLGGLDTLLGGRAIYPGPGGAPARPGAAALTAALATAWRKTWGP
ncbi:protein of unknown function [Candidatus Hydrogenisulfobacillus filiaventi]|uniref:Uncharacterized protein n=1 Tax=Candidatus Hydrogenisulfobacillus filiaventi TaxID=2707344 RepID=A0A6F8ZHN9_9FIRM|nr:hypothetical protein [Bacillota bacterium]CAB1129397.1 protein of unknown function [Candidatus Hydrogenisulfobacillus filiaventi]